MTLYSDTTKHENVALMIGLADVGQPTPISYRGEGASSSLWFLKAYFRGNGSWHSKLAVGNPYRHLLNRRDLRISHRANMPETIASEHRIAIFSAAVVLTANRLSVITGHSAHLTTGFKAGCSFIKLAIGGLTL